ncbi:MAG: SAVED domain-containing protein [Alphaproteobacteria bacterium]|nr:SAVED domain-containing protein [Alphaproteobacteria bacterium]
MVSPKTRAVLWARGAGRCYYCNTNLIGDFISGNENANFGFVAHIVARTPNGPRGDEVRSPQLDDKTSNLMLMCHQHHKLIDVDELANYPEQRLLDMKTEHEERVAIVTGITPDRASHVLRYGAKIGNYDSPVAFPRVRVAMLPKRFPYQNLSTGIQISGSVLTDGDEMFWITEPKNLERQFQQSVGELIASGEITHLSIFALGPIPLLVQLGALLGDIMPADVYQLCREPAGWRWAEDRGHIEFEVVRPITTAKNIALKLGISATINDDRINSVLGTDTAIWAINAKNPGNDVMRHEDDLVFFRRLLRTLNNDIKVLHGQGHTVHVFPAVPVSVAVEIGRVRMPKADLPLLIYDQMTAGASFAPRLTIS